jgi:hypothetical protein
MEGIAPEIGRAEAGRWHWEGREYWFYLKTRHSGRAIETAPEKERRLDPSGMIKER